MRVLEPMAEHDHEQVMAVQNRASGLRGFIAIHDTTHGPALGGIRVWAYPGEEEALADVLRLSRAMTYKAAAAELPCGGGKAVVILHPGLKREQAFEDLARVVDSLAGRFFTGPDVGITPADLEVMARHTRYVADERAPELGDISEHTALGVWHGMRACLEFAGLSTARVAIQGVGAVGMHLARILRQQGMEVLAADTDRARAERAAEELGACLIPPDRILGAECEVLAPCALGGVITAENAGGIRARVVCGSANNVLATAEAGDELARRGVLYAPDYVVNAGGLIRGAEFYLLQRGDSRPSLERIHGRVRHILETAAARGVSTARVADEWVQSRLLPSKRFRQFTWSARA